MTTQEETRYETDVLVRHGIRRAAAGHRAEAIEALSRAVKDVPEHAFGQLHLAMALTAEGRFDEAKAALDEALNLRPNEPAFHLFAGEVHFDAGDYRDAANEFRRALELNPNNILAKGYVALAEWANGRDAPDISLDPGDLPDSTPFLARLLMLIEREMKGCAQDITEMVRPVRMLDRPRMGWVLWRAEGARKRGDLPAAVSFVEMALELYPGHPGALRCLKACRQEALAAAEQRVKEEPESLEVRFDLASQLAEAERYEEADAALKEVRRVMEGAGADEAMSKSVDRLAAHVEYGLGRIDEALQAATSGAEPGFTMSETHYYLGLCHLALGERRRCAEEFERLVAKLWWAVPLRYREYLHWRRRIPTQA
jgi:tetratricopeptide (TPR) repeat protein